MNVELANADQIVISDKFKHSDDVLNIYWLQIRGNC